MIKFDKVVFIGVYQLQFTLTPVFISMQAIEV